MWCGHREHNHLSPIGPSDIRRSRVCGHNECLQWSLSCSFIQILQTTDSHSIMQQSQYNTEYSHITNNLYTQFLTMTVLLACPPVSHKAGSVLHPFVVTRSLPVSYHSPHISHRSPGSAQPCHPRPRWLQRIVSCVTTNTRVRWHRIDAQLCHPGPNDRGLFVIYWVKFDIPRKGREERESDETQYAVFRAVQLPWPGPA